MWHDLRRLLRRRFSGFRTDGQTAALAMAVVVLVWLPIGAARAEEVTVRATVDRATVALAESCVVTVAVAGSRAQPDIPAHAAFAMQPRGSASRVSIVNGRMSASVEYRYVLQPLRTGTFTIGPATVMHDGRRVTGNALTIVVTDRQPDQSAGDAVFVTASLDHGQPYVHQQIICSFRFYRRVPVSNARLTATPSFDGFVSQQLGSERQFSERIDGYAYTVTELRYALVPSRTGVLRIEPFQLACEVAQGRGSRPSPFGDFFFNAPRTTPRVLRTDALSLTVRPLPAAERPAGFANLVGKFALSGELSADRVQAGESVTLTLVLAGTGNLASRQNLPLPDVAQCKVYDDAPVFEPRDTTGQAGGVLTLKRALVPLHAGTLHIPPVRVAYFDPVAERYCEAATAAFTLHVDPAADFAAVGVPDSAARRRVHQEIVVEGYDILPVHTSLDVLRPCGLFAPWRVALLLACPWLLVALVAIAMVVHRKRDPDRRARRAYCLFQRQLRVIGDSGCYADGGRALRALVGDLFDLAAAGMTADDLDAHLRTASIPDATRCAVVACVREAEDAQFNPGVDTGDWELYRGRLTQAAADLNRVVKR